MAHRASQQIAERRLDAQRARETVRVGSTCAWVCARATRRETHERRIGHMPRNAKRMCAVRAERRVGSNHPTRTNACAWVCARAPHAAKWRAGPVSADLCLWFPPFPPLRTSSASPGHGRGGGAGCVRHRRRVAGTRTASRRGWARRAVAAHKPGRCRWEKRDMMQAAFSRNVEEFTEPREAAIRVDSDAIPTNRFRRTAHKSSPIHGSRKDLQIPLGRRRALTAL